VVKLRREPRQERSTLKEHHTAEILGEDNDEDEPLLENNAHEVLHDGDDDVGEELNMETYQAFAAMYRDRGIKINKATWDSR